MPATAHIHANQLEAGHWSCARREEETLPGLGLAGGAGGVCEALQPSQNALHSVDFEATNIASTSFHFVVKNTNPKFMAPFGSFPFFGRKANLGFRVCGL